MRVQWGPDILGAPFQQATLPLGDDADGTVVATLVRALPGPVVGRVGPCADVDVLSVHGWSDYFFQPEAARFWTSRGARFFALDLRRYGRSIRPGQPPGDIGSLDEYDADIAAALAAMGRDASGSRRRLVLQGHSTGGLTFALWAARHPGTADALVLNSPWLELQLGRAARSVVTPIVEARARLAPQARQPNVDLGFYTRAQRAAGALPVPGYRADWRPERGFRGTTRWLAAILDGHRRVAAGIDVGCPALVLLSARSVAPITWSDDMAEADSVLAVDEVARAALHLGRLVTVARIDGALHDVFLSRPAPRARAFQTVAEWMPRHRAALYG